MKSKLTMVVNGQAHEVSVPDVGISIYNPTEEMTALMLKILGAEGNDVSLGWEYPPGCCQVKEINEEKYETESKIYVIPLRNNEDVGVHVPVRLIQSHDYTK